MQSSKECVFLPSGYQDISVSVCEVNADSPNEELGGNFRRLLYWHHH